MYTASLENELIIKDIVSVLPDYVSVQSDLDETRAKAAETMAQRIDLVRLIGKDNVLRCIDPQDEADEILKSMIIAPLCYFTYARLLKNFQGSYQDGGYSTEELAENRNAAKSVANETTSVAEVFMTDVVEYLENEGTMIDKSKSTPKIRVFGGKENFAR